MEHTKLPQKIYLAISAAIGWFGLLLQFYLAYVIFTAAGMSPAGAIVKIFSYFTILTNIVVAVCFTIWLLRPNSNWGRTFSRPQVSTAIAVYILFVGISYSLLLRHLWAYTGWDAIVNEILHTLIPILFVFYWLVFAVKARVSFKIIGWWLVYPIVYLVYVIIRGAMTDQYPYPFIDVTQLGYPRMLVYAGVLIVAFLILSVLFIAINNAMSRPGGSNSDG